MSKIIGKYGKCVYCGVDFGWLLLEALMIECGARAYPKPTYCSDSPDNKHHVKRLNLRVHMEVATVTVEPNGERRRGKHNETLLEK